MMPQCSCNADVNPSRVKALYFEDPADGAVVQSEEDVLSTLRDLATLDQQQQQQRSALFHRLVSGLRSLSNDTLSRALPVMLQASQWLTWQALLQCGTPHCTSAMLLRAAEGNGGGNAVSLEWDALVYGLSLQADPDQSRVRDMLSVAQHRQSRAIMFALANTVRK